MLRRMVAAGLLGRKSGRGFADYGVVGPGAEPAERRTRGQRRRPLRPAADRGDRVRTAGRRDRGTLAAASEIHRVPAHAFDEWAREPLPASLDELRSCEVVVDTGAGEAKSAESRFGLLDTLAPDAVLATASPTQSVTACGWA